MGKFHETILLTFKRNVAWSIFLVAVPFVNVFHSLHSPFLHVSNIRFTRIDHK